VVVVVDCVYPSNSVFEFQDSYCHDVVMRKTVVDYIAWELSKKPHSVVFLDNVNQADFLVQNSLFQAISIMQDTEAGDEVIIIKVLSGS